MVWFGWIEWFGEDWFCWLERETGTLACVLGVAGRKARCLMGRCSSSIETIFRFCFFFLTPWDSFEGMGI